MGYGPDIEIERGTPFHHCFQILRKTSNAANYEKVLSLYFEKEMPYIYVTMEGKIRPEREFWDKGMLVAAIATCVKGATGIKPAIIAPPPI